MSIPDISDLLRTVPESIQAKSYDPQQALTKEEIAVLKQTSMAAQNVFFQVHCGLVVVRDFIFDRQDKEDDGSINNATALLALLNELLWQVVEVGGVADQCVIENYEKQAKNDAEACGAKSKQPRRATA